MTTATTATPAWLAEEVDFLARASHHLFGPAAVEVVETHQSWVFLTDRYAYKLKKAIRLDHHDLASRAEREAQCRNEVALNRRLTRGVYLGVLPLTRGASGLAMDGSGAAVDWLVWMRRLPPDRMLDRLVARGRVDRARLRECIAMLSAFYDRAPPAPVTGPQRRGALAERIAENTQALREPGCAWPAESVEHLARGQLEFLRRHARVLDRRVQQGRVVEGHGDLRPEHVCLVSPPQVIDCLDFSRELRTLDTAEELGFLALECTRLGAPQLEAEIFEAYRAATGDRAPRALVHFYQSVHAAVRAKLAAWHRATPGPAGIEHWTMRARDYLDLSARHLEAALGAPVTA